jgi:hypothetical protein
MGIKWHNLGDFIGKNKNIKNGTIIFDLSK